MSPQNGRKHNNQAYSEEQRQRVKLLLEEGKDETAIELATKVSDRTVRRWRQELEATGRIGKPPEARTGRNRVLTQENEQAILEHSKAHPNLSVDDLLWWLYEVHGIVVGTRTVRRVFERKGEKSKPKGKKNARKTGNDGKEHEPEEPATHVPTNEQYLSPYAPMTSQAAAAAAEQHLQQALQHAGPPQQDYSAMLGLNREISDDPETIELELQQIALQKREVELKLKMRRLRGGKNTPNAAQRASTAKSSLYDPNAVVPSGPKRDSRSKRKIEESKKRTAERQERMLRDLERRSRRRDHLTAEWVLSKDIWPLRAQGILAGLMHQYGYYAVNTGNNDAFEAIYRELYQLVDHSKNDWTPHVHDQLLRERMKRKMGQLRTKMQKTGEIVGRTDGYAGFTKAEDYTGEQAGDAVGDVDETELAAEGQTQPGAAPMQEDPIHYDPVPEHHHQQMQQSNLPYAPQYAMPDQQQYPSMLPYGQMGGQPGGMVL